MCHLLLLLPVLALPVFWLMPLALAVPVYGTALGFSVAIYWYAVQAMKRPVLTGAEGIIGETGEFVESSDADSVVRIGNELWRAACGSSLRVGDQVKVVAVEGLTLKVQKLDSRARDYRGVAQPPADTKKAEL